MVEEARLETFKDTLRAGFNRYTHRAYHVLPILDRPAILDIGCGSGMPTMELARLSDGQIVGMDVDQAALDRFVRRMEEAGLSDRVKAVRRSMLDMNFADESFNIIWAEGSIAVIGFAEGLREWRRFLRPGGFLVVHDEKGNIEEKLARIRDCGYRLLDYFVLDSEIWWNEMYAPLEKQINEILIQHGKDKVPSEVKEDQPFIETLKKNPGRYSSVFFIMEKLPVIT